MNKLFSPRIYALLCVSGLLLWMAADALAQTDVRVRCEGKVELDWEGGAQPNIIYFDRETSDGLALDQTGREPSSGPHRLAGNASYKLVAIWDGQDEVKSFSTSGEKCKRSAAPSKRPLAVTCPYLPASIVVSGYGTHTQCKQVGEANVGKPELIAQGILDAVDIFGSVDAEVRVCFSKQGSLKFLDAATSPRAQSDLPAERSDGMTCGRIDRAGTVVLLQGGEAAAEPSEPVDIPPAAVESDPGSSTICQLTTTGFLSLRAGPNAFYARTGVMPYGAELIATAKDGNWYLVEYEEQSGWANDAYLTKSPGCDAIGGSNQVFLSLAAEPAPVAGEAQEAQPASTAPGANALLDCSLTTGDIINLRASPGTEQSILAEIPNLTQLNAEERSGDWFKVEYEGSMGWVNIDYVFRRGACG